MTKMLKLPRFILVTGQEGCGKDSYANHLASLGYLHISAGDLLREIARQRGHTEPLTRELLSTIGDDLRRELGPGPLAAIALKRYEETQDVYPAGLVISGFRSVDDAKAFQDRGAVIVWMDATPEKRFANQAKRRRDDQQDWQAFLERGRKEYYGDTAGGKDSVNLQAIEQLADCKIDASNTIEDFISRADPILAAA